MERLVRVRDLRRPVDVAQHVRDRGSAAENRDAGTASKGRDPIWDPVVADGVGSGHEQSFCSCERWGGLRGLNPQPSEPQSDALPIELRPPRSPRSARPWAGARDPRSIRESPVGERPAGPLARDREQTWRLRGHPAACRGRHFGVSPGRAPAPPRRRSSRRCRAGRSRESSARAAPARGARSRGRAPG